MESGDADLGAGAGMGCGLSRLRHVYSYPPTVCSGPCKHRRLKLKLPQLENR